MYLPVWRLTTKPLTTGALCQHWAKHPAAAVAVKDTYTRYTSPLSLAALSGHVLISYKLYASLEIRVQHNWVHFATFGQFLSSHYRLEDTQKHRCHIGWCLPSIDDHSNACRAAVHSETWHACEMAFFAQNEKHAAVLYLQRFVRQTQERRLGLFENRELNQRDAYRRRRSWSRIEQHNTAPHAFLLRLGCRKRVSVPSKTQTHFEVNSMESRGTGYDFVFSLHCYCLIFPSALMHYLSEADIPFLSFIWRQCFGHTFPLKSFVHKRHHHFTN